MSKEIKITIVTCLENESNLIMIKLVDTWKVPGTPVFEKCFDGGIVEITLTMDKAHVRHFKRDINVLSLAKIYATVKD